MKANRKTIWNNDDRAQVGIGTMIVFIATILVAATAAAVLVDTSGKLQERSSSTGNDATKQVASNLIVQGVSGGRETTAVDIGWINVTVTLAPGATSMDLSQLKVQIVNADELKLFDYNAVLDDTQEIFAPLFTRDIDGSDPMMNPGDLVDLQIHLRTHTFTLAEREDIKITLMPEIGAHVDASFTTPESYGTAEYLLLR